MTGRGSERSARAIIPFVYKSTRLSGAGIKRYIHIPLSTEEVQGSYLAEKVPLQEVEVRRPRAYLHQDPGKLCLKGVSLRLAFNVFLLCEAGSAAKGNPSLQDLIIPFPSLRTCIISRA